MVAINQTVTVVNRSGKIVSSSKHLVNVFNEARAAYTERKGELKAQRVNSNLSKDEERRVRKELKTSSKARPAREDRPAFERGATDDASLLRPQPSPALTSDDSCGGELTRRHTDWLDQQTGESRPALPPRPVSPEDIDLDLAYGELPPPLPERKYDDEVALRLKARGLQQLLDECNCLQHSASAIIAHLQANPDALAAVALTLGEISNLAAKAAPGALASLKTAFPAVIALLASPEFVVAIGVGVGVTIVALGGYKIVKKIRARKQRLLVDGAPVSVDDGLAYPADDADDELRELEHVEAWRRGISDADAQSLGTSVDGEFITPAASRTLIKTGRLRESDLKERDAREGKKTKSGNSRSSRSRTGQADSHDAKANTSSKESSGLKMLFKKSA